MGLIMPSTSYFGGIIALIAVVCLSAGSVYPYIPLSREQKGVGSLKLAGRKLRVTRNPV